MHAILTQWLIHRRALITFALREDPSFKEPLDSSVPANADPRRQLGCPPPGFSPDPAASLQLGMRAKINCFSKKNKIKKSRGNLIRR